MAKQGDQTTVDTSDKTKTNTTAKNTGTNTSTGTTVGAVDSNQQNGPLSAQLPYYQQLWEAAGKAFGSSQGKTAADLYAGPNQIQKNALNQVVSAAPGMSTGVPEMRDLALSQLRGDWLDPNTNPYIKNVATAAIAPVQQQFDANKLAISDRAIAQGAYGGSRQDLQELQALDDFSKTSGNITSNIYANNYANERGIQQGSGALLDKANILALAGPTALSGAGALQQGWDQAGLNAKLQAPWTGMSELANILGAGGFGASTGSTTSSGTTTGTTTSTGKTTSTGGSTSSGQNVQTEPAKNPLLGIIQGLMGGGVTGANLATGIGGVAARAGLGAFAPWMLPFAALGGLAGAL